MCFLISKLIQDKITLKAHYVGRHREVRKCWIEVACTSWLLNCIMIRSWAIQPHTRPLSIYTIVLCLYYSVWPSPYFLHTTQNMCWTLNYWFYTSFLHGITFILYKKPWVWPLSDHLKWRDGITPILQMGNWGKRRAKVLKVKGAHCL